MYANRRSRGSCSGAIQLAVTFRHALPDGTTRSGTRMGSGFGRGECRRGIALVRSQIHAR